MKKAFIIFLYLLLNQLSAQEIEVFIQAKASPLGLFGKNPDNIHFNYSINTKTDSIHYENNIKGYVINGNSQEIDITNKVGEKHIGFYMSEINQDTIKVISPIFYTKGFAYTKNIVLNKTDISLIKEKKFNLKALNAKFKTLKVPAKAVDCDDCKSYFIYKTVTKTTPKNIIFQINDTILKKENEIKNFNVQELSLAGEDVFELPKIVFNFTKLKQLWLNDCSLNHIPDSIATLKELELLFFSNNNIKSIPNSFSTLKNLKNLTAYSNSITAIPKDIGQLEHLRTLSLFDNKIKTIPKSIAKLDNLKHLNLSNNQITAIPIEFFKLKNIISIDLSKNKITTVKFQKKQ